MLNISIDTMFGSDLPQSTPAPQYAADEVQLIEDYRSLDKQGKEYIRHTMYMATQTHKKMPNLPSMEEQA